MHLITLISSTLLAFTAVGATFITNDTSEIVTSYDYIIVGGGTTGLAVANRLSVNYTVLVVERGADERDNEVTLAYFECISSFKISSMLLGDQRSVHNIWRVRAYPFTEC